MGTGANRNFASVLDDLFVAKPPAEEAARPPSIPFDYLSVADELHSGRIKVSSDEAAAEYRRTNHEFETELAALLAAAEPLLAEVAAPAESLPSIEPAAIAVELGLDAAKAAADFSRLRRSFAFKNHPDRVEPHLRQRAMVRMQVANMLIDDAKRRAAAKR
ncbi:MAG TPA: hypothetical protein VGX71_12315 [Pseudaminobacter sp.]|nr:hypothetical protein [Pseudaminobacter sp.]